MTRSIARPPLVTLAALAAICSSPVAEAQSGEFMINTDPGVPGATLPVVSTDPEGNFVVVWEGWEPFPFDVEVYGKRFDAEGSPLGEPFRVNTTPVPPARPSVASDAAGNFVAIWTFTDVLGQRYDAAGGPLGGEFAINTSGKAALDPAAIAIDDDGDFVAVWAGPSRGSLDVFGQRFSAFGHPLGGEFPVNVSAEGAQLEPDVAASAAGDFVVVWQSEAGSQDVFGRRYDASGTPLGGEFQVNTHAPDVQHRPAVGVDAAGNFVVVWESNGQDGDGGGIFGRRFDLQGNALGGEFQVNTSTEHSQSHPDVSSDASGAFTVVWDGLGPSREDSDVFAREYDADGTPIGAGFPVNSTSFSERFASVALDDSGNAVVVYERVGAGAFGQILKRFDFELSVSGACPGAVTASLAGAPPSSEVGIVAAANTNGFIKGGVLCAGTELEIGEPFKLPPTWVKVDGEGNGAAELELAANQCWLQAMALVDCSTSNVATAP